MSKEIKSLLVKDKWHKDFGILSYNLEKDKFSFKYCDNVEGYEFSDINIKNGREFEQSKMFNVFMFDDSYIKHKLIINNHLSGESENHIQWFLKEQLAETKKLSSRGFYFEKI